MLFDQPTPLTTALRVLAERGILPTALDTNGLRGLTRELREKALFSARTLSIDYLGAVKDVLARMLRGEINLATARQELQLALDALGYTPETGFPPLKDEERGEDIPPADEGSLRDLSSDKRIDLVLNTNLRMAANLGEELDQSDPDALYQFPCWELSRWYEREVPRGYVRRKSGLEVMPGDSWPDRWARMGGKIYDGRLIARKDDPIWEKLGDSGIFRDGTDSFVPPYAFNSGFDRLAIGREEAIALGVMQESDVVQPRAPSLAGNLFRDPVNATLGELTAARDELRSAAAAWGAKGDAEIQQWRKDYAARPVWVQQFRESLPAGVH